MAVQIREEVDANPHIVSLDEFERMCVAGVFEPEARIELIRGRIVDMAPIGPGHMSSVARLNLFLAEKLQRSALVWPQGNAIRMPASNSFPQPDITVLKWRDDYYQNSVPGPEDVLLLVEVSESSLKYDQGSKLTLYAEAGIAEYWVVNLPGQVIEVYTQPVEGTYKAVRKAKHGELLPLPGKLEGSIAVDDILS